MNEWDMDHTGRTSFGESDMTQPEALRLADELEMWTKGEPAAAELRRLHEVNQELLAALEKLARLGNGEHYGNSDGNMIARAAIAKGEKQND
jgi:hypothetical protein